LVERVSAGFTLDKKSGEREIHFSCGTLTLSFLVLPYRTHTHTHTHTHAQTHTQKHFFPAFVKCTEPPVELLQHKPLARTKQQRTEICCDTSERPTGRRSIGASFFQRRTAPPKTVGFFFLPSRHRRQPSNERARCQRWFVACAARVDAVARYKM
jgi:hypothetical protein